MSVSWVQDNILIHLVIWLTLKLNLETLLISVLTEHLFLSLSYTYNCGGILKYFHSSELIKILTSTPIFSI